jgi:hypothetical protein
VGALPLLLFVCIVFVTFDVLLPHGLRAPALFVYSWVPLSSALVCIGDLVLGIVRWKKSLAFSIGIFTALFLLLLISPGLLTVWALGSDGFVGH